MYARNAVESKEIVSVHENKGKKWDNLTHKKGGQKNVTYVEPS